MPAKPAWFPRIGSILADLRVLNSDYLDRKAVERIFGVRQRCARQLMGGLPTLQRRASSQRSRALDWHFGQCRFRQVMERSPLPALWGVISNGEWGDKGACLDARHALSTLHYGLPFSSSSSLSGGRNLPLPWRNPTVARTVLAPAETKRPRPRS